MDLFIDVGNTNLKWATGEAGTLRDMQLVGHHGGLPIDLYAAWERLPTPRRILVSNVGGTNVAEALNGACLSFWERPPTFAKTRPTAYGVTIAYERPERLGVDRWLALIAAHRSYRGPVLIIDAGTAITYDLLLENGQHLGGLILPGVEMMRAGLLARTHIPRVEPEDRQEPWAADTGTAIAAGSIQAPAALAERLFARLTQRAGEQPTCILTGGDAEILRPELGIPIEFRTDLVLQGLTLLA